MSTRAKTREVEALTEHISEANGSIKFTEEDVKGHFIAFLDCEVHIEEDRSLNTETHKYRSIFTLWLSPFSGTQTVSYQNPTSLGWEHAYKGRGIEEGAQTHQ